jgi:hypothetical protein
VLGKFKKISAIFTEYAMKNLENSCVISGFRRGINEICALLEFNAG